MPLYKTDIRHVEQQLYASVLFHMRIRNKRTHHFYVSVKVVNEQSSTLKYPT